MAGLNFQKVPEGSEFNLSKLEKANEGASKTVDYMSNDDLKKLRDTYISKVNIGGQGKSRPDEGSLARNDIPTTTVQPSKPGSIPERYIVDGVDQDGNTYTTLNKNQVQNNSTGEIINVFNG